MKLFKRKPQETIEEPKNSKPEQIAKPTQLWLALGIICAGFLLAGAILVANQFQSEKSHQQEQLKTWADGYLSNINQSIQQINTDAESVAVHPGVIKSIAENNEQAMAELANNLRYRANAIRAHLSVRGQASIDNNNEAPINYAALDLIANAENGHKPAPEFIVNDGKRYIYKAAPVYSPGSNRIIGTILLIYDAKVVTAAMPSFADASAKFTLVQNIPGAPELTLITRGLASNDTPLQAFRTAHPYWTLNINQAVNSPFENQLLIVALAALTIVLVCSLGAVFFFHISFNRQISKDSALLATLAQHWLIGKSSSSEGIKTPALRSLANAMSQRAGLKREEIANTEVKPAPKSANATEQQAAAKAADAQEQETFDIDVLDIELIEVDPFDIDSAIEDGDTHSATDAEAQINKEIFRAYDIRGIFGQNLTRDTAYWIGRAVGSKSLAQGQPAVAVARDGRLSGPELMDGLISGLIESGCHVTDLGMVPTPVLYFATHSLEATTGVMLTGSHNPAQYNGFKIVLAGQTLANEQITELYDSIVNKQLASGQGSLQQLDILPRYLERITSDIALARPLKVVVDCGNGVAGVIGPQLLEAIGCEVIPLYAEVDGSFPNHHPDPGQPENLADLITAVSNHQADLGIAFDGDGDRLGVVTEQGRIIYPDHLMMLLAKDIISRNPGADIIFDVKCSRRLGAMISGYGGRAIMWKTGHSLIKAKMRETGALLAGEMSGHIFYKERWYGFDDGIYSAARLLEILALDERSAHQIFGSFVTGNSTPEINIEVTEGAKFRIIENLQENGEWGEGKITTIDGVRVDYPKGWGLVRASNTTPSLVLRFEGDSEEELRHIQIIFRDQLLKIAPINWPLNS